MNLNKISEYSKYLIGDKIAKDFMRDIIACEEEIRELEYNEKKARKAAEDLYIKLSSMGRG